MKSHLAEAVERLREEYHGALAKATEALRAFGEAVRHSEIDVAEYEED